MIINIYDEGIKNIDFGKIRSFIDKNFGRKKVRIIKLEEKIVRMKGLLFDLIGTQRFFRGTRGIERGSACNIVLTDKLFATLDEHKKPHIRASIYGDPSVISISGIIEGPARPKDYYIYKQRYTSLGAWELKEPEIKRKFKGRFIDYNDRRLTEVLKGYIAQALFFYITEYPFCDKKSCRLYNAHWQRDLIYSQIKSGKFCNKHENILEKIKEQDD